MEKSSFSLANNMSIENNVIEKLCSDVLDELIISSSNPRNIKVNKT